MYLTQLAINSSEPFKYRVIDDEVRVYSDIAISIAVTGDDEMLRFCELSYLLPFSEFTRHAKNTEECVKAKPFNAINPFANEIRQDVIHMSVLPWFDFTSFSNARITNTLNSIPKIVFGKCNEKEGKMFMPLSVEVHHGMMDGLHVSRFVETLQGMFDTPRLLTTTDN
jgi:chloramphenicol O-acetyltransferase type A